MKLLQQIKAILITVLLTANIAAHAIEIPTIAQPKELVEGQYAEGTITQMSDSDVQEFLPWAENAKKILTDAVKEAKRMPIAERVSFIEGEMRHVVTQSQGKSYQMLMRFALNRGLLLSDIIKQEANTNDPGIIENQLNLLENVINIALEFHESDISFQERAQNGDAAINIDYYDFGTRLAGTLFGVVQNIFDASAQLRVLYKTFEMMNWDISRDLNAKDHAEMIVEIHRTLRRMSESSSTNDQINLKNIRTLNYLRNSIAITETSLAGTGACAYDSNESSYQETFIKLKSYFYNNLETEGDSQERSASAWATEWVKRNPCQLADNYLEEIGELFRFAYGTEFLDMTKQEATVYALDKYPSICGELQVDELTELFKSKYELAFSTGGLDLDSFESRKYAKKAVEREFLSCNK